MPPSVRPSLRPSLLPSVLLLHTQSSCDHLTHTQLVISSSDTHTHFFSSHISTHNFIYSPFLSHLTSAVAGAVSRDCRRGCGARCRRWCRWLPSAWQAQYPEWPALLSSQSFQKGLRRALSPLAAFCVAGAVSRASRRLAARVVAAGCPRGRRSSQSLQKGLRRALSPLVPLAAFRVAGAVARASRRACGARCRRWCRWLPARGRRSIQSLQKGLRRALSPLVPLAVRVAVARASRRACGARCRRWCRWVPSAWQAQYPEPPEGPAARVVAAGAAGWPRGRRSSQSLQKGLRRALSPLATAD